MKTPGIFKISNAYKCTEKKVRMIAFRLLGVIGSRIESNINLIHMEAFCKELQPLYYFGNFRRFHRGKFSKFLNFLNFSKFIHEAVSLHVVHKFN